MDDPVRPELSTTRGRIGLASYPDDLSLLGHDIRAAVSDIVGGLRLIDAEGLPAGQQVQFDRVRVAGEALAGLVDRALMRAAGEEAAGGGVLALLPYLDDIDARWTANAAQAGVRFALDRETGLPDALAVDRLALDRILSNLLFNAIKYADGSHVRLAVATDPGGRLSLSVRDGGPGFSAEALARLFERNGRPAGSRPGTGLGLHVAKTQADAIGAEIIVRDAPGGGAEVVLRLPDGMAAALPADQEAADLRDLRVLLAEDNATSQLLIGGMLRRMGADVEVVADGLAAADALAAERFDLALLDIEMPGISGIDLIAALKADGEKQPPLIALTAYVLRANRDAIFAAGADGIIAKPVASAADFGRAIRRHVDYAATSAEADWPAEPGAEGDELMTFDEGRFARLMDAAGPEEGAELIRRLVQDLASVDAALGDAVRAKDMPTVRAQTHILIALAGAVGAARLQHRAERLNRMATTGNGQSVTPLAARVDEDLQALIHRVEHERPG